jgi:hypothetical protein
VAEQQALKQPWVRLHLERQSSSSYMPSTVVGKLHSETATAYVLVDVPEEPGMHVINKTYVWDCHVLPEEPPEISFESYDQDSEDGGLG